MTVIYFQELKRKFSDQLKKTENTLYLIDNEISSINTYLSYSPKPYQFKHRNLVQTPTYNSIFNLEVPRLLKLKFIESFHSYLRTGDYELIRYFHDTDESYRANEKVVLQAKEFSKYFLWLKELQRKPSQLEKPDSKLGLKEKLVALHYLGLDLSNYENNKSSKILSQILGHSEENVRKYLSYLNGGKNEVRNERTLKNTLKLFNVKGFEEISSSIEADIEKTLQK